MQTKVYHGDSYWGEFEERIGSIDFTVSPDGFVQGTIDMYAYCMNPLSENYFKISFSAAVRPEGGFRYFREEGDVHLGAISWLVECSALGVEVEGNWSHFDNFWPPHGEWHGSGRWRAHRMSG